MPGASLTRHTMDLTIIENGERIKYIREGECNLCGACCCKNVIGVKIVAGVGNSSDDDTDWGDWEGYSEFWSQGIWWWVKLDIKDEMHEKPCAGFVDGKCVDWDTRKFPAVCRYFPVRPRDIEKFPECGFSFRRVE